MSFDKIVKLVWSVVQIWNSCYLLEVCQPLKLLSFFKWELLSSKQKWMDIKVITFYGILPTSTFNCAFHFIPINCFQSFDRFFIFLPKHLKLLILELCCNQKKRTVVLAKRLASCKMIANTWRLHVQVITYVLKNFSENSFCPVNLAVILNQFA